MALDAEFLDCCGEPTLEVAKRLSTDDHDSRSLLRCTSCGTWWLHRFYEYIRFDVDLPDDQIIWYVRLTEEKGQAIQAAQSPVSLSFLACRPCFRQDERGVMKKTGMPWP